MALEDSGDSIRLMSVHKAKGLEFPVVILCDSAYSGIPARPGRYVDADTGLCAQRLAYLDPVELAQHRDALLQAETEEADRLLGMIRGDVPRPSEGVEAELTAPVETAGLTPTVGQVRVLEAADRAMVELAWIEDADPEWTEESRWAVLDRSEGSWRVERMVYLGTMRSLLDGAGLAWPPTA